MSKTKFYHQCSLKNGDTTTLTHLPEEYALPKGSFIAETFSLLNELNILTAIDKDENRYYLTREDKLKVFDELFLKRTDYVSHKDTFNKTGYRHH